MGLYPGYMETSYSSTTAKKKQLKKKWVHNNLNRHLLKEDIYMVSKHMKKCPVVK